MFRPVQNICAVSRLILTICFCKGCMPQAAPWARDTSCGKAKNYSTTQESAGNGPAAKEKVPGLITEELHQQKLQWEGGKNMSGGSISMKRNVVYWTTGCTILPAAPLRCFLLHRGGGRRERVPSVPARCLYTGSLDQVDLLQCFMWAEKSYGVESRNLDKGTAATTAHPQVKQ